MIVEVDRLAKLGHLDSSEAQSFQRILAKGALKAGHDNPKARIDLHDLLQRVRAQVIGVVMADVDEIGRGHVLRPPLGHMVNEPPAPREGRAHEPGVGENLLLAATDLHAGVCQEAEPKLAGLKRLLLALHGHAGLGRPLADRDSTRRELHLQLGLGEASLGIDVGHRPAVELPAVGAALRDTPLAWIELSTVMAAAVSRGPDLGQIFVAIDEDLAARLELNAGLELAMRNLDRKRWH